MGQGQTVAADQLMVFHDATPIAINYVGFTSVSPSTNNEWLVPDEFISGPGKSFICVTPRSGVVYVSAKRTYTLHTAV